MKVKEESKRAGLRLDIKKTKIIIWPRYCMANRRGKGGSSDRFPRLGLQITVDGDCSHEIKTVASWQESDDRPRQCVEKQSLLCRQRLV